MTPHVVLELVDDDGREVEPGQMGHVVVTGLDGYRMPLIRYALGDIAARCPDDVRCPCGRGLPLLDRIIGRDTDIVRTPQRRYLNVHFFTGILEFVSEIRQFQVVQDDLSGHHDSLHPGSDVDEVILDQLLTRIRSEIDHEPFDVRFQARRRDRADGVGEAADRHFAAPGRAAGGRTRRLIAYPTAAAGVIARATTV